MHAPILSLLLPLLALAGAALSAPADAAPGNGPVRLELLDRDTDQVLTRHPHRGQQWVAGERGHRYAVRLRNASAERVLVVLSVDGINAVSGEDAEPSQTGYVLRPWQSVDIAGWRKSNDEIAQFVFSSPQDSYGARTGRADNLGVVGIAVFEERRPKPRPVRIAQPSPQVQADIRGSRAMAEESTAKSRSADSAMAPSPASPPAPAPAQRLGTAHGEREHAPVSDTQFDRASATPVQVAQLRYDSARNLRARGIALRPVAVQERAPQAFPRQFVPDPPQR